MEKQRVAYLHHQYLNDVLSQQELQEWNALLKDTEDQYLLARLMDNNWEGMTDNDKIHLRGNRSAEILEYISMQSQKKVVKINWRLRITAAAAILFIGIGLYFYRNIMSGLSKDNSVMLSLSKHDIAPGHQSATLTLASGKQIELSDVANGEIAKEAGISVAKTADGQLVYQIKGTAGDPDKINTLTTAKGETYILTLPDQSKVWLNAASSLTYSSALTVHGLRRVKLEGEAYFEISKDKAHPFIVENKGQEVKVLGTHFNINAYGDEPAIATTLLEGSVRIVSLNPSEGVLRQAQHDMGQAQHDMGQVQRDVILKPGEQAINNGRNIQVKEVNMESVTDWKNGDFFLNHVNFRTAMRKIARWYDVEVIYDPSVPEDIESGGWISRNNNLSSVLKLIELSGLVHFKVEGKRIYVTK